MTEEEWLACDDPETILVFLRGKVSDRKMRLFACACCRRIWNSLHDKSTRKAVECSEQFADMQINKQQLIDARKEAEEVFWRRALRSRGARNSKNQRALYAADAVRFASTATGRAAAHFDRMRSAGSAALGAEKLQEQIVSSCQMELQRCNLLRDIFGNPFRPIATDPAWLTPTAVSIADAIYRDRAFDRLPILADALEESGCTNADILLHCRQPGDHVRGCWVVDLILGTE